MDTDPRRQHTRRPATAGATSSCSSTARLVVRRLGVTAEWRGLDWTDEPPAPAMPQSTPDCVGAARSPPSVSPPRSPADDRAEWRGGLSRADRERLWAALERTYRDVRDLELMRIDAGRLPRRPDLQRLDQRCAERAALMITADPASPTSTPRPWRR